MLIYPKHSGLNTALLPFYYSDELRLWVEPFCIEKDGLLKAKWISRFSALSQKDIEPELQGFFHG